MAPITSRGDSRYEKHRAGDERLEDVADLGTPMLPQDVLIWLRNVSRDLTDDDYLTALQLGADRVHRDLGPHPVRPDAPALVELSVEERQRAVVEAREVTRARFTAWRRRNRQMTWRELRVLFVGLREMLT